MERFVRLIVGGGLALAAGLWIATLADARSLLWAAGVALALVGTAGLAAGIHNEVEY